MSSKRRRAKRAKSQSATIRKAFAILGLKTEAARARFTTLRALAQLDETERRATFIEAGTTATSDETESSNA
jgi:3-methyladenine DNA glycosylase AlkD